ncbi:nuclear distribution protein PAC1-like protein [Tanacetum coccineum]
MTAMFTKKVLGDAALVAAVSRNAQFELNICGSQMLPGQKRAGAEVLGFAQDPVASESTNMVIYFHVLALKYSSKINAQDGRHKANILVHKILTLQNLNVEAYALDVRPATRAIREPRVVVQTTSEAVILDDGHRRRKYGQEDASDSFLLNHRKPRRAMNAIECVSKGCALECAIPSPNFKVTDFQSLEMNASLYQNMEKVLVLRSWSSIFLIFFFSFSDLDFSLNNQYIASSSLDKTVRVWDIPNGLCIRVIYGVTSQLCIRFHPVSVHQQ